ncbi:MAG: indole-3-glycerol phosphate synthase TrpC [Planctomycetia bacterium]|nr:indole-3-glycerol phosphate synthase TrpC [Planctomycetia bacterium]
MNALERIVATKHDEIDAAKQRRPAGELERLCADMPPVRGFRRALTTGEGTRVIAEVKGASPSAGIIRADFDPVKIAQAYAEAGAACISVLTDGPFFHGSLDFLRQVRAAVDVPLLRKDFLLDPYQLLEAREAGADCALLIAEILPGSALPRMLREAEGLGLETLVELYDPDHLPRVLEAGALLIGVNNRDLRTFNVDLGHTLHLAPLVPPGVALVSESGIRDGCDTARLRDAGVRAVLVGETLMRSDDITRTMRDLMFGNQRGGVGIHPSPSTSP